MTLKIEIIYLYRRLVGNELRLKRLEILEAPDLILAKEKRLISKVKKKIKEFSYKPTKAEQLDWYVNHVNEFIKEEESKLPNLCMYCDIYYESRDKAEEMGIDIYKAEVYCIKTERSFIRDNTYICDYYVPAKGTGLQFNKEYREQLKVLEAWNQIRDQKKQELEELVESN